jgi:hypothetical protein
MLYSLIYITNAATLNEAGFHCLCKPMKSMVTELMAQRTEFDDDSSKLDAFIGYVYWRLTASADHMIDAICCDAT